MELIPGNGSHKHKDGISNVEYMTADVLHPMNNHLIDSASLIMLDTFHNGDWEQDLYDYLIETNWKGIMLCDDIHLNSAMKQWWNNIPKHKKLDITKYGHWSGTGLVWFGKKPDINLVNNELIEDFMSYTAINPGR